MKKLIIFGIIIILFSTLIYALEYSDKANTVTFDEKEILELKKSFDLNKIVISQIYCSDKKCYFNIYDINQKIIPMEFKPYQKTKICKLYAKYIRDFRCYYITYNYTNAEIKQTAEELTIIKLKELIKTTTTTTTTITTTTLKQIPTEALNIMSLKFIK
jgi:hypothetical protein